MPAHAAASGTGPTAQGVSAVAAKPAAPASKPGTLQANGLIARTLRDIDQWVDGLGTQLAELRSALLALLALFARSGGRISDTNRQLLLQAAVVLIGSFACGLALEWCVHRLLKHPLAWLVERADRGEARGAADDARQEREQARQQQSASNAVPDADQVLAGTRPSRDDVAMVSTVENGVEKVEEVPVGERNTGNDAPSAPGAQPSGKAGAGANRHQPSRYVHALRRLMYALGSWLLDLLPLAVFLPVSALLLHWLADDDARIHAIGSDFVEAYVSTRVIMATLRLLVSPLSSGMRILQTGKGTALILQRWVRCIVALVAFGNAIGASAQTLGATGQARFAFIKIIALFVHIAAVTLVFRLRRPVRRAIAAKSGQHGLVAASRNWLARMWVPFAFTLILGEWVVWALGVEDGFPKLIHVILITAAILIAARLATVLLQGMLGRAFHADADASAKADVRVRLTRTYYPFIKTLVSLLITVCALIALFQAWGLDAFGWFSNGAIGRSLTSAAMTILVASIIAIVIWEAASISIERRIDVWSQRGDVMRAARLRTLLPMLRTSLLVGVVLVVGLTALNEIGINTTPLLASASIVGVALGFGSQKLVQDFITGIFLLMENAMQVGDWVTVAGVSGTVENLSVRTVRLRGGDGSLYTVPFSSVTTVNNTHRGLGNAAVSVSVSQENDIERAIAELKSIGAELRQDKDYRDLILKDIEVWGVDAMDGSKITLIGQMQCTDSGRWGVQREINARIVKRFREKGIELANPRMNLLLTPEALRSSGGGEREPEQGSHP
ncbi:mechanosensitive ion channel family protein [Dyella acidiphila]|uniref:mechanosensitive ion channel family protein n=1 Tax=Dyella acidiphila TaxID=2775866 RepID=UPI0030828F86